MGLPRPASMRYEFPRRQDTANGGGWPPKGYCMEMYQDLVVALAGKPIASAV